MHTTSDPSTVDLPHTYTNYVHCTVLEVHKSCTTVVVKAIVQKNKQEEPISSAKILNKIYVCIYYIL